jgi:hypothetical protein
MPADPHDVASLVSAVEAAVPGEWPEWPGGWPGKVEAALIDAVLSIRATYGQIHNGVRGAIQRWRAARDGGALDDLAVLASGDPTQLADTIANHQKLSGGSLKALAITEEARSLLDAGVRHAADLAQPAASHKQAYTSVRGLGPVTWTYFLMLLGTPGVKADTWIVRFVERAFGRHVSPTEAAQLLTAAAVATHLNVSPTALDHAIWNYMRSKA